MVTILKVKLYCMKIGVLIPNSKIYPQIGFDFMNGLRIAAQDIPDLELLAEGIDFGAKDNVIIDKVQKLLFQGQFHAIIALGGLVLRDCLTGVAETSQIPILVSDLGGDTFSIEKNEWLFHNSLEFCKSSWLMGTHMCDKGYKNIGIASSFYDAGYPFMYAFSEGIKKNNLEPAFTHVLPYETLPTLKDDLLNHIKTQKPEAIFGTISHDYAALFLSHFNALTESNNLPIYGTSTMCSEDILEKLDKNISITNITTWVPELDNAANKTFMESYQEMFYKNPSLFSVLGYENGLALKHALKSISQNNPSPKMLTEALKKLRFEGPRSTFSYNEEDQIYKAPHWLVETSYKDKNYSNTVKKEIDEDQDREAALIQEVKSLERSGWLNPYLCI